MTEASESGFAEANFAKNMHTLNADLIFLSHFIDAQEDVIKKLKKELGVFKRLFELLAKNAEDLPRVVLEEMRDKSGEIAANERLTTMAEEVLTAVANSRSDKGG